jgi:ABC-type lipoprotein release transport system permease subunit
MVLTEDKDFGVAASLVPAMRALAVDPTTALRSE